MCSSPASRPDGSSRVRRGRGPRTLEPEPLDVVTLRLSFRQAWRGPHALGSAALSGGSNPRDPVAGVLHTPLLRRALFETKGGGLAVQVGQALDLPDVHPRRPGEVGA